jgi:hypothetical protein
MKFSRNVYVRTEVHKFNAVFLKLFLRPPTVERCEVKVPALGLECSDILHTEISANYT